MSFLDLPEKNANVTLEVRANGLLRFNYRPVAIVLGGEDMYSTTMVNDNVWHHFAAVKGYDVPKGGGGVLRLYVDGYLEVERFGFFADINIAPMFEMGRNRYEPQINYRSFHGNMDDLKIWQRAKSSFEIFTDFKSESSGLEPGIYSNYKFDVDADTVYDCSPYQRHGIAEGLGGLNNLPKHSSDIPQLVDKMCETELVEVNPELKNPNDAVLAKISPNPVADFLNVEYLGNQTINGQIYASDGRLVLEITFADKVNNLDVSALPSGTYLIKLSNAKTTKTQRFIKI